MISEAPTTFVGHPYAAIGKGEEMRANMRALMSLGEPIEVRDVFGFEPRTDADHLTLVQPLEVPQLGSGNRIFHINGDEVDDVLNHLEAKGNNFAAGYNIIVPAWELPKFPEVWAQQLKRFDEVWAISDFVKKSLAHAGIDSIKIGQSLDLDIRPFLSRRHLGIRESAFTFLVFMDFSSYAARKNPWAAIEMFGRLLDTRPFDDIQLVLKMKGDERAAEDLLQRVDLPPEAFVVINKKLSTYEQHSLISACDCLVSLHRAEGFGRGPGEAMRLGRGALATGWSGNLDFMDRHNSMLVEHELIRVAPGDYPESDGQVWADPDIDHATSLAKWAIDNPADFRHMSGRGFDDVIMRMGNRAVGLRMLQRLKELNKKK